MDGPFVKAAKLALEKGNVNLIFPWLPKKEENELKEALIQYYTKEVGTWNSLYLNH